MDYQANRSDHTIIQNVQAAPNYHHFMTVKNEYNQFMTIEQPKTNFDAINFVTSTRQVNESEQQLPQTIVITQETADVEQKPESSAKRAKKPKEVKEKKPRKKKKAGEESSPTNIVVDPNVKPKKCRGKDLHVQTKEMIQNVYNYFKKEAIFYIERPLMFRERSEFKRYLKRTAEATGRSPATVMRVMKEYERTGQFASPKKRAAKKRVTVLSSGDREKIKQVINSVYNNQTDKPSCRDLLKYVRNVVDFQGSMSSFRRVLHEIGFKRKDTTIEKK